MQPRLSPKRDAAMMLFEVGVTIAIIVILAAIFLPALAKAKRRPSRINCVNHLKQIGLSYKIWAGDNGDVHPMGLSTIFGGSLEMVATGNVVRTFQVMSNELGTTKILICTTDVTRTNASSFSTLANTNLSYFVGVDVTNDLNPQMILSGDANFALGGVPVKSGVLDVTSNSPVAWTAARHRLSGNLGLADGSVCQLMNASLAEKLGDTGQVTNRFAIP